MNNPHQFDQKQFHFDNSLNNNLNTEFNVMYSIINRFNIFRQTSYTPKNNFGLQQKEKIINYLIQKNVSDEAKLHKTPLQKFIKNNVYGQPANLKQQMRIIRLKLKDDKAKLQQLEVFKLKNRTIYVNQVISQYNQMRYISMAYGCVLGSALVLTCLRNSTSIKKAALLVTFTYLFSQYSSYNNMDLIFDKLYPLFKIDLLHQMGQNKIGVSNKNIQNIMQ